MKTDTNEIKKGTSCKKLHHDPELLFLKIRPIVSCDLWTFTLRKDQNLLLNVFDFVFRALQIDDLDGYLSSGRFAEAAQP